MTCDSFSVGAFEVFAFTTMRTQLTPKNVEIVGVIRPVLTGGVSKLKCSLSVIQALGEQPNYNY